MIGVVTNGVVANGVVANGVVANGIVATGLLQMVLLQMAWLQMGVKMATTMVGSFFLQHFLWDSLHQRIASLFQVRIFFSCILMKIINKGRVFSAPSRNEHCFVSN